MCDMPPVQRVRPSPGYTCDERKLDGKRTKQLPEKEKKKKKKRHFERQAKSQASEPFHTIAISIPQRRKSREKKTKRAAVEWPWNHWFHKESTTWSRQVWGLIIVFRGSGWIHLVVFMLVWQFSFPFFFLQQQLARNTSTPRSAVLLKCDNQRSQTLLRRKKEKKAAKATRYLLAERVKSPCVLSVMNDNSRRGSHQPRACRDGYVDRTASAAWHHLRLIGLWLMKPVHQGRDHDIWPPLRMCRGREINAS